MMLMMVGLKGYGRVATELQIQMSHGGFFVLHGGWQGLGFPPPISSASTSNKFQEKIPLKQLKNAFNVSVQARQI